MKLSKKQRIVAVPIIIVLAIPAILLKVATEIFYILSNIFGASADKLEKLNLAWGEQFQTFIKTVL
jgi:hypothetical protein